MINLIVINSIFDNKKIIKYNEENQITQPYICSLQMWSFFLPKTKNFKHKAVNFSGFSKEHHRF